MLSRYSNSPSMPIQDDGERRLYGEAADMLSLVAALRLQVSFSQSLAATPRTAL